MKTLLTGILCSGLLLGTLGHVLAQFPSDKFRDVNTAGPYPIYITAQGVWGKGFDEFAFLSKAYDKTNAKRHLWGFEAAMGFIINEKNRKVDMLIEPVAFRYLQRSQQLKDRNQRLTFIYQTASIRGGLRYNFFYPVTLHILAGPIFYYQQVARIDRDSANSFSTVRYYNKSGLFVSKLQPNNKRIPGFDLKIRLNLLDAISSSGGLGIYLEAYASYINKQRVPVERIIPGTNVSAQPANPWNRSYSIGAIIPLALRVKKLLPESCDWCKKIRREKSEEKRQKRKALRQALT